GQKRSWRKSERLLSAQVRLVSAPVRPVWHRPVRPPAPACDNRNFDGTEDAANSIIARLRRQEEANGKVRISHWGGACETALAYEVQAAESDFRMMRLQQLI
ncbi:MAG: hypothetical protein WCC06_11640, partial [Candidatus Aminicenantales bacterium]